MFRRTTLIIAILLIGVLALSACTAASTEGTGQATETGDATTDGDEQSGPKTATKLTIGIWNTTGNITTYTVGNSWNDWILWLSFDKLREPSPYVGVAENWLAESIEPISDDGRIWEIKLRDGIKWHDGTPLTAEDVAFTFVYYREGPSNRWTHHCSAVPRGIHRHPCRHSPSRRTSR